MKKTLLFLLVLALALVLFPAAALADSGTLGKVHLITGSEIEIEFDEPVLNNVDAHNAFTIRVDDEIVDWEFLSYFDFGPYALRGGVVNVRLADPLDAGEPRGRKRESSTEYFLAETQSVKGPAAAARIRVTKNGMPVLQTATATFEPFYTERSLGNMSRMWVYGAANAGSNGQQIRDYGTNYSTGNVFSASADPKFTDEYVTRQVAEGINRFVGRSEYLNLPMVDAGFKALIVGPEQSVYEAPEYRELYKAGVTTDTYTRTSIKATEVPGNFDGDITFVKPYIVGTSDDVMRYNSPLDAAGEKTSVSGLASARPRSDHFHFAEAFFDMYYHLGVKEGCTRFPLSSFNDPEDYRYDHRLTEAYEAAQAAGLWPGSVMMQNEKNYYVYGALVFYEMIPETQVFTAKTYPVNTRAEMYEYDYPLYYALAGTHGKYEYWTGTGTAQALNAGNDTGKYNTPWFWHNQPDNFGLPATVDGTSGVPYEPLKIEQVTIVSENTVDILFNREVKTVAQMATGSNWKIYIDGREVTGTISQVSGYNWKRIRLRTNCTVNYGTGAVTNSVNRLDNGKPYGRYFAGFSQSDLDERSVANGGWIANNQSLGINSLEFGQFVSLDDAINIYGAGPAGKVEVEYVGPAFYDWDGNAFTANVKHEAVFQPWVGHAYRSPLTGLYIYLDTAADDSYGGHYDAKDVAVAGAKIYETNLLNNKTITYPTSAGGTTFDDTFADTGTYTTRNGAGNTTTFNWNNGTLTVGSQSITNGPVTYDRIGQRIADGSVRGNGGMIVAAGSVLGNHPGMQPQSNGLSGNLADSLRVEGWGGTTFQAEDVLIMRDYNLCRYKNENLVLHEGGHGIDSFTPAYAQQIYNDITAACATALNPKNGARWADVSGVAAYCGYRGEYVSTLSTFYAGMMREQFQGLNDGTWTPICSREELFRYDPFGFEAFKRLYFIGELGLWYENQVGDPDYRVMPEDWEVLRDTYPEFSHWTSMSDLIAWGASVPETAYYNPYTGQKNELSKWTSWKVPNVWDIEPYKVPDPDDPAQKQTNIYDFVGGSAYNPDPEVGSPTVNQEHPFFRPGGVKKPVRPAEIEALAAPVRGTITDSHATILPRPVLVQFEFTNYDGEITSNNVQTTFELMVDGQYTHFYLWEFKEVEPGVALATLRLDWPLEADAEVVVGLRLGGVVEPVAGEMSTLRLFVSDTLVFNFDAKVDANTAPISFSVKVNGADAAFTFASCENGRVILKLAEPLADPAAAKVEVTVVATGQMLTAEYHATIHAVTYTFYDEDRVPLREPVRVGYLVAGDVVDFSAYKTLDDRKMVKFGFGNIGFLLTDVDLDACTGIMPGGDVIVVLTYSEPVASLQLTTDAQLVEAGDYFHLYPSFTKPVASNAATLEFAYNKTLFEYRGFTPAAGVTLLSTEQTSTGVKFTLMVSGYDITEYGDFLFSAKEDVNLENEEHEISVTANYVVKLKDGTKEVWKATASTRFSTGGIEPGDIDLIVLSNLIDVFGITKDDPRWAEYKIYDRNNNGQIDINDITYVAQQIK